MPIRRHGKARLISCNVALNLPAIELFDEIIDFDPRCVDRVGKLDSPVGQSIGRRR